MLIVAEKFRTAKILAKCLGFEPSGHFFKKSEHKIIYAQGHLVRQLPPNTEIYQWHNPSRFESLPNTFKFEVTDSESVIRSNRGTLSLHNLALLVIEHMQKATTIVNACDADRSGEQIFYDLFNQAQTSAIIYRMDLSRGLTRSLIQFSFDHLLDGIETKRFHYSSQARGVGDSLYIYLTRVYTFYGRRGRLHPLLTGYTDKIQSVVTVGRVQTPTLQLIATRCHTVEQHPIRDVQIPCVTLKRGNRRYHFVYRFEDWKPQQLANPDLFRAYIQKVKSYEGSFSISNIEVNEFLAEPPALFDTSSIQAAMGNLTPSETMAAMQELYMQGLITYPRTDSNKVPIDEFSSSKVEKVLNGVSNNLQSVDQNSSSLNSTQIQTCLDHSFGSGRSSPPENYGAVKDAHTAIIPTGGEKNLGNLSPVQLEVYNTICERFAQQFSPTQLVTEFTVTAVFDSESLGAMGESQSHFVLKHTFETSEDSPRQHPIAKWNVGDVMPIESIEMVTQSLNLPNYYAVSEIPLAMKNVKNHEADIQIKELLEQSEGLGTAATRDSILDKLLLRNYVEIVTYKDDIPRVVITSKGLALLEVLPKRMKSPVITALWEAKLLEIENAQNLKQSEDLRNSFILEMKVKTEKHIQLINKRLSGSIHSSTKSRPASKETRSKVNRRSKEYGIKCPDELFISQKDCERWLSIHPERYTKAQRNQLKIIAAQNDNNFLRDERKVASCRKNIGNGATDRPPTSEHILLAEKLSKKYRIKLNKEIYSSAYKCSLFIKKCRSNRSPTTAQISKLRRMALKLRYPLTKEILNHRGKTLNLIKELQKEMKRRGIV